MANISERDIDTMVTILDHCDRIEEYIERFGKDYSVYQNDFVYQDAVKMRLFQIGECSNRISEEGKQLMRNIPWHKIYGLRNIIGHGYEKIVEQRIWGTIIYDIPELKQGILFWLNHENIQLDE